MKLLPTKKQWTGWSLPSKLTAIGAYASVASMILFAIDKAYWTEDDTSYTPGLLASNGAEVYVKGYELDFNGSNPSWLNTKNSFIYVNGCVLNEANANDRTQHAIFTVCPELKILEGSDDDSQPGYMIAHPKSSYDDRFISFKIRERSQKSRWDLKFWDGANNALIEETEGTPASISATLWPTSSDWHPYKNQLAFVATLSSPYVDPMVVNLESNDDPRWSLESQPLMSGVEHIAWSPSGEEIALATGGGGIYKVSIYNVQKRTLVVTKEIPGSYFRWLTNDELLFITGGPGDYELSSFRKDDLSKKHTFTRSDTYRYFDVSQNGAMIAYWEDGSDGTRLYVKNIRTGAKKLILKSKEYEDRRDLAWNSYSNQLVATVNKSMFLLYVD